MINLFNRIYSKFFNDSILLETLKFNSLLRYSVRKLANRVLPIYLNNTRVNINFLRVSNNETQRVIVSLTSFPKRINQLWMVIDILLRQTVKADKILLYLSKEQFPHEYNDLPKSLLYYKDLGLEITFVDGDIRSHKKYYYAFRDYPNDIIITVDDDIFYPTTMIETLIHYHKKYPDSVICRYARKIEWDCKGEIKSSRDWTYLYKTDSGYSYFFGTGGGTLFPAPVKSLYKDTLDLSLALRLAPLEDDLWLNTMTRLQNTSICVVKDYKSILSILCEDDSTLYAENGVCNKTNDQMHNIVSFYSKMNLFPYRKK